MRPLPGTEVYIKVVTVSSEDNSSDLPYSKVSVNDSQQKICTVKSNKRRKPGNEIVRYRAKNSGFHKVITRTFDHLFQVDS